MGWLQTNRVAVLLGASNPNVQTTAARESRKQSSRVQIEEDRELFAAGQPALQTLSGPTGTNTRPTTAATGVPVSQSWFLASWLTLIALHCACGVYLILSGYIHVYMTTPRMGYISGFIADKNAWHFKRAAILYTCIGAMHLFQAVSILIASLRNRALVFCHRPHIDHTNRSSRVVDSLTMITLKTLERQGLLDHQGGFTKVFTVQEIFVVLSQTYQANRCCNLLSRSWINLLYVALVIANCWVTPALCFPLRGQRPALLRATLHAVDALFNMGSCFVLPFVIFWPYYRAFDTSVGNFPLAMQNDSTWQIRLITEMQTVFALSLPDLLSKVLNNLTVFASLLSLSRLLIPPQETGRSPIHSAVVQATSLTSKKRSLSAVPAHTPNRWIALVHLFLISWGLSLLVIYGAALSRTKTSLAGCTGLVHPWFSTKYSCSIFEVNCYRRQVESPTTADLVALNPDTLLYLCVSHCPNVKVPVEIQDFPYLLSVHVHNSTIAEWSAASSISAKIHTRMTAVVLTRCNMTAFPQGLLQPMPAMLSAIVLSHTNLTTLPTGMREVWKPILDLVFDYSDLLEIPASIFQLDVLSFSFVGNRIQRLPALDDIHKVIQMVDLGFNPLQELPAAIGTGAYMGLLNIEDTNISEIPPWVATNLRYAAASGSPYCALPALQRAANVLCYVTNLNPARRVNITLIDQQIPL